MSLAVKPGDVLDGKYVIERLLGQGGMGAVFVAHEEQLGRKVAIKVLLPEVVSNPEAIARFEREARAAASLESDHVTRVLSIGRQANGSPYIVMELLEGEDLAASLARRGPQPAHEVISLIVHACDALAEAHTRGIVHRDLKPANLFFARRANGTTTVKVLDFGISKATVASPTAKGLTSTSALMGTPIYMSPEQLREARNVDGRADIWALGVTMYELLAGTPPFVAEGLAELCVLVLTTPHPPLSSRRPDIPPGLEAIVDRCLRKDASERFATAGELSGALIALEASLAGIVGPPTDPRIQTFTPQPYASARTGPEVAPRAQPMTVDGVSNTWMPAKRVAGAGIVIGGAALLLGAVIAVVAFRLMSRPTSAVPAAFDSGPGLAATAAVSALPDAGAAPIASASASGGARPPAGTTAPSKDRPGRAEAPTTPRPIVTRAPIAAAAPVVPAPSTSAAHPPLIRPTTSPTMSAGPPPIPLERR